MVLMTHACIHTVGGTGLLHKHFHSEEDSSDVWAHRAEPALSRIQRSVWTEDGGFSLGGPQRCLRICRTLKTWLSSNSLHMSSYITDLPLGITSSHACRNMINLYVCAFSEKNPSKHKVLTSYSQIFWQFRGELRMPRWQNLNCFHEFLWINSWDNSLE